MAGWADDDSVAPASDSSASWGADDQVVAPPKQATPPPAMSATGGMSTADKILAGTGKALTDTWLGARQAMSQAGDAVAGSEGTDVAPGPSSRTVSLLQEAAEKRKTDKELEGTYAGKAGELLGHMVLGLAAPEGLGATVLMGGLQGATIPTVVGESRDENILMGSALGSVGHASAALLGKVVGGVIQPFRADLSKAGDEAITTLNAAGVPMNAAQQGASNIAGFVDSSLTMAQRRAFTAGVLKPLGIDSEEASGPVMQGIRTQIGATLDQQAAKNPISVDQPLLIRLATIQTAAEGTLTKDSYHPIEKQIDNIMSYAAAGGGTINGKLFQNLRSELSLMQKGDSGVVGHWAGELQDAVSDALERQAPKADTDAIVKARSAWRMMRQIEPAIDENNYVNPSKLYNNMDLMSNINQMVRGQGDQTLVKLAQAGKILLTSNTGKNAAAGMGLLTLGSTIGAVDALVQGKPLGATTGEGALTALVGASALTLAAKNPASARIIGRWARSKAIAQFREGMESRVTAIGGNVGGSALPSIPGAEEQQ